MQVHARLELSAEAYAVVKANAPVVCAVHVFHGFVLCMHLMGLCCVYVFNGCALCMHFMGLCCAYVFHGFVLCITCIS